MQLCSCGNDGGGDLPIRGKTMLIDAPPAKRGGWAPGPKSFYVDGLLRARVPGVQRNILDAYGRAHVSLEAYSNHPALVANEAGILAPFQALEVSCPLGDQREEPLRGGAPSTR